jgi:hypothetical protein
MKTSGFQRIRGWITIERKAFEFSQISYFVCSNKLSGGIQSNPFCKNGNIWYSLVVCFKRIGLTENLLAKYLLTLKSKVLLRLTTNKDLSWFLGL